VDRTSINKDSLPATYSSVPKFPESADDGRSLLTGRWRRPLSVGTALSLIGCASFFTSNSRTRPDMSASHKQTIDEACGNPTRWPISQDCLNLIDSPQGPLLQQKSDLIMAVRRSCPSADPCALLEACQKPDLLGENIDTSEWEAQKADCVRSQQADYSCAAIQKDREYRLRQYAVLGCLSKISDNPRCAGPTKRERPGTRAWNRALDRKTACLNRCLPSDSAPDCRQAEDALDDFQQRVHREVLDAALKAAFSPP
jgi:hypothetical protein